MLVGNLVFFEQLGHFFGHHRIIILNGDEGDFFSRLGRLYWRGLIGLFGWFTHVISIHQQSVELPIYSNASNEDFSGNCRLQPLQVTK